MMIHHSVTLNKDEIANIDFKKMYKNEFTYFYLFYYVINLTTWFPKTIFSNSYINYTFD